MSARVRIGTGNVGGVFFPYGNAIAAAIRSGDSKLHVDTVSSGGAVDNLQLLARGDIELALTTVDAASDAQRGISPFDAQIRTCALAVLYRSFLHVAVRTDSGINAIPDMRGKRISFGPELSSTEVATERLLGAAGVSVDDVQHLNEPIADSVADLLAGRVDGLFWVGGVPGAAMVDLMASDKVRMLSTGMYAAKMSALFGDVYEPMSLAKTDYPGLRASVSGVGVGNILVVREDANTALVERVVAALFARIDLVRQAHPTAATLTVSDAQRPTVVPFHPGATKFYARACAVRKRDCLRAGRSGPDN